MSSPTPIITPPPTRPKKVSARFDFEGVTKRVSTWLSGVSATSLIAYAALPDEIKSTFPEWFLWGLGVVTVILVPVATSFRQKSQS